MDYVFMANAVPLILCMQYMDLSMSLAGRVFFPLGIGVYGMPQARNWKHPIALK